MARAPAREPGLSQYGRSKAKSEALVEASRAAQGVLGRPLGSHVLRAGPVDWHLVEAE